MQKRLFALTVILAALSAVSARASEDGFSHWAAVVVAGDWHTHDGGPSEAFDNARRDVTAALLRIGFERKNIAQFSVRPWRYPAAHPKRRERKSLAIRCGTCPDTQMAAWSISAVTVVRAVWFWAISFSHPGQLSKVVNVSCENKPAIIVLSACFSGGFVPDLSGPERLVFTAARRDRASFGCSSSDKYPFFDACFLKSIATAHDFPALADRTRACVGALEQQTGMTPPSQPQLSIGSDIAARLPKW